MTAQRFRPDPSPDAEIIAYDDVPMKQPKPDNAERITRIITVNEPGYEVALFFNEDGGAEAVIRRPGDKLPIGINIAPPTRGRCIAVERSNGRFEVVYRDRHHD